MYQLLLEITQTADIFTEWRFSWRYIFIYFYFTHFYRDNFSNFKILHIYYYLIKIIAKNYDL